MVKSLKKVNKFQPNRIKLTSPVNNVLTKKETPSKSKQQIDKEYYQKNKEKKRAERKERYQQQKKQTKSTAKQGLAKYYKAENIRVLISLKEYTELNSEKRKK
ncbi:10288_t:CDS:1 [Funneliformis geosporum]|uniref:10288_t:CDS:1 n=1 Tax=Funneliformis geosporum TaxID=1117311 RepID=A0A9W4WTX0_9GLOM|nr:10288_t:CDS:1 [Funneliformis geosporum]